MSHYGEFYAKKDRTEREKLIFEINELLRKEDLWALRAVLRITKEIRTIISAMKTINELTKEAKR